MEGKKCYRCNLVQPLTDFYKRSDRKNGYMSYCKICARAQAIERQRSFKKKCVEYKGNSCERCGYNRCDFALEFHHKDPTKKDFSLSQIRRTKFGEKAKKELDKCTLLCANCHREEHYRESDKKYQLDALVEDYNLRQKIYNNKKDKVLLQDLEKSVSFEDNVGAVKMLQRVRKIRTEKFCCDCNVLIRFEAKRCQACQAEKREVIKWPSTNQLIAMVEASNYSVVGRELGVSDNAIRKRIRNHPIKD